MQFKRKYEKIPCSNEHVFSIDFDGVVRQWKCVVLENEVVTYEDGQEKKHLKITNRVVEPHVLQIDTVTSIYGEMIPFQLENNIPFIQLEGEWVPSDTFAEAKQAAAVNMYRRQSRNESIVGGILLAISLGKWIFTGDMGQLWILSIFGAFFIATAMLRLVRLRNELRDIEEAQQEAQPEVGDSEVDAIAAARAAQEAKKG